jgi:MFS family permease
MSIPLPGRDLPLVPRTFRALGHRDFRLLWLGQLVSLTGSWMQSVAQGWLVLRLGNSAFHLGLVGFCNFAPVLLFALVAGVAADRLARRRALYWTQGSAMVLAFTLAALTATGTVRVWHVALLAFGAGTAGAFDIPIRQSLLQDLVGREDLPNAIALNSLAFNGARLLGPALGGLLLAELGEAMVFLVNGLSYLAVLVGLALMRTEPATRRPSDSWLSGMREGIAWVRGSRKARLFLALVSISSVFGLPYSILLPVFARDVLGVGARGLGFLTGATGLGATVGALYLAGRGTRGRGVLVAVAMALLGASLVAFALSRAFALSLLLLVLVGAAMIVQMATSNTLLQLLAPEELRGRIVSFYMLAFLGTAPVGSLLAGTLAHALGTPAAVAIGGAVCLAAALWFAFRLPRLRRGDVPDLQRRSRISTS